MANLENLIHAYLYAMRDGNTHTRFGVACDLFEFLVSQTWEEEPEEDALWNCAVDCLVHAGLVIDWGDGTIQISPAGKQAIAEQKEINFAFLKQYPGFRSYCLQQLEENPGIPAQLKRFALILSAYDRKKAFPMPTLENLIHAYLYALRDDDTHSEFDVDYDISEFLVGPGWGTGPEEDDLVNCAEDCLIHAGLMIYLGGGEIRISPAGKQALAEQKEINFAFLKQYPGFRSYCLQQLEENPCIPAQLKRFALTLSSDGSECSAE